MEGQDSLGHHFWDLKNIPLGGCRPVPFQTKKICLKEKSIPNFYSHCMRFNYWRGIFSLSWEPTRFSVVLIQEIVIVGDGGHVALHVNVAVFRVFVCYLTKCRAMLLQTKMWVEFPTSTGSRPCLDICWAGTESVQRFLCRWLLLVGAIYPERRTGCKLSLDPLSTHTLQAWGASW